MDVKMTYNDEVISLNEHFINEPINKLIENLRVQNFNLVHYSDLEIILNFYDLNLKLNEDNIYANDVSLFDLQQINSNLNSGNPLNVLIEFNDKRFITLYNQLANRVEEESDELEANETDNNVHNENEGEHLVETFEIEEDNPVNDDNDNNEVEKEKVNDFDNSKEEELIKNNINNSNNNNDIGNDIGNVVENIENDNDIEEINDVISTNGDNDLNEKNNLDAISNVDVSEDVNDVDTNENVDGDGGDIENNDNVDSVDVNVESIDIKNNVENNVNIGNNNIDDVDKDVDNDIDVDNADINDNIENIDNVDNLDGSTKDNGNVAQYENDGIMNQLKETDLIDNEVLEINHDINNSVEVDSTDDKINHFTNLENNKRIDDDENDTIEKPDQVNEIVNDNNTDNNDISQSINQNDNLNEFENFDENEVPNENENYDSQIDIKSDETINHSNSYHDSNESEVTSINNIDDNSNNVNVESINQNIISSQKRSFDETIDDYNSEYLNSESLDNKRHKNEQEV